MLKILQARCQQYMYWELPDVQAGLEKAEEPVIKLPTFIESWRKQGNSRKTSTFASWNSKPFDCVNHNKLWKILKELGTPDHLICLLRKLYGSQEAIVRILCGTTNNFGSRLRKEYNKAVWCHPVYHEECWAGWITSQNQDRQRIINNLSYVNDTTLMAENEDELKNLLVRWRRRVKELS